MHETAVADTGPLLHLAQIGQEGQLTVFVRMSISRQVQEELARRVVFDQIAVVLGEKLVVESVASPEMNAQRITLTGFKLHQTDVSVVALAAWLTPDGILTAALELRRGLEAHGYIVVGSVGILVQAYKAERFSKTELYARLDQLLDGSTLHSIKGFRTHVRYMLDSLPE